MLKNSTHAQCNGQFVCLTANGYGAHTWVSAPPDQSLASSLQPLPGCLAGWRPRHFFGHHQAHLNNEWPVKSTSPADMQDADQHVAVQVLSCQALVQGFQGAEWSHLHLPSCPSTVHTHEVRACPGARKICRSAP